ncbi:hypothetical protein DE146DRAFT_609906 [Phaeosphaeria sp. MPI-PUGE-AT-0046c]|nr:hypothetical protein DE146DRAFT_609906 [Phaeosphaeria sp. MPI-PUGE-AT-0046c]
MLRPAPPAGRSLAALRASYLAASLLILVIQLTPALRRRFLAYGSRATPHPSTGAAEPPVKQSAFHRLLDRAAAIQVPHNYFTHFYITSVACSLFWACWLRVWEATPHMQLVWSLMLLQGVRRMFESFAYTSTSTSSMWFAHWVLGLLFYLTINVAIWIEGLDSPPRLWATAVLVPAILTAHVLQHSYHAYLYRLRTENKGYQLPLHPVFSNLLCPHYTCEVVIYLLLSFLAAPQRRMVNWTLVCATIFVATNLGVTAAGTKEWYTHKFGLAKVGPRKRMIPRVW